MSKTTNLIAAITAHLAPFAPADESLHEVVAGAYMEPPEENSDEFCSG